MSANRSHIVRLDEAPSQGRTLTLEADPAARKDIARRLDLQALDSLTARIDLSPWFDGVEIAGDWNARLTQKCVVTLEPLESVLSGRFVVHLVPPGSLHAPSEESASIFDPDADDPPEIAESGEADLAELVVEHLALEIDPYPRKEGAVFQPPGDPSDQSPFAALRALKKD